MNIKEAIKKLRNGTAKYAHPKGEASFLTLSENGRLQYNGRAVKFTIKKDHACLSIMTSFLSTYKHAQWQTN